MSLKHGLLGLLNYGPMTGYELGNAFKASLSFFWQAKTSQIYRELDKMEQNGWLSSEQVIQMSKPNKRVYSITDTGKSELIHWLSSPEADMNDVMHMRSGFLMRLFFAGEIDERHARSLLTAYRQKCAEALSSFDSVPDAIAEYGDAVKDEEKTKYWKITALYGEAFFHAGMSWAEKALALLGGESD